MKLIRLVSDSNNAFFDNSLPDLSIEPNSQIALLNASFDTEPDGVVIDESNNTIELSVNGQANVKTIVLDNQIVTQANFQNILDEISTKGNEQLTYNTNGDRGSEIKSFVNSGNKIQLGYRNSRFLTESVPNKNFTTVNIASNYTQQNAVFSSNVSGGTSTNERFGYIAESISKGTGQISCRCFTLNLGSGNLFDTGFFIGVTETDMTNFNEPLFDASNMKIGVRCIADNEEIRTIVNGGPLISTSFVSNPTGNASNRDIIAIRVSRGIVQAVIHQDDGSGGQIDNVIATVPYDGKKPLFPFIVIRGAPADTVVDKFKYYLTPYEVLDQGDELNESLGSVNPIVRRTPLSNNFIQFLDQAKAVPALDLAQFFGFDNARNPPIGFVKSGVGFEIIGDNQFDFTNFSDAYLIEMLNIPITSWDGEISRKRNLLSVIPLSNDTNLNGVILYEASTPIFLDIDNSSPILLRNIQCRIVKNDNSTVILRGLATMTILIRNQNERL